MQLDRGALTALTGVAAAASVALLLQTDGMATGVPVFLAAWLIATNSRSTTTGRTAR